MVFRIYRDIIDLKGHCDNRPASLYEPNVRDSESIGILEDINELERHRIKRGGEENKIVAIMPKDYLSFHYANSFDREDATGAVDIYGFVLHRHIYTKWIVFGSMELECRGRKFSCYIR